MLEIKIFRIDSNCVFVEAVVFRGLYCEKTPFLAAKLAEYET